MIFWSYWVKLYYQDEFLLLLVYLFKMWLHYIWTEPCSGDCSVPPDFNPHLSQVRSPFLLFNSTSAGSSLPFLEPNSHCWALFILLPLAPRLRPPHPPPHRLRPALAFCSG